MTEAEGFGVAVHAYYYAVIRTESNTPSLGSAHPVAFLAACYRLGYQRLMMELLSLMAVMLEGLGFNLCVAPFLNVCVPNLPQGSRTENVRGGQSWVRGVILELDEERLSQRS